MISGLILDCLRVTQGFHFWQGFCWRKSGDRMAKMDIPCKKTGERAERWLIPVSHLPCLSTIIRSKPSSLNWTAIICTWLKGMTASSSPHFNMRLLLAAGMARLRSALSIACCKVGEPSGPVVRSRSNRVSVMPSSTRRQHWASASKKYSIQFNSMYL